MNYEQSLLAENERVAFSTRQHWIVLLGSALVNILTSVVLGIAVVLVVTLLAAPPLVLLLLILLLFPIGRFVARVLRWWNEQYLITNRRVIQSEGMVNKRVIDSSLEKVNDVVLVQSLWGRLLDYGNIDILTASEVGVNRLEHIANPTGFKTQMLEQKEKMRHLDRDDWPAGKSPVVEADIPELIAELDTLRSRGIISDEEFNQKKKELLDRIR